jgi:hypothetical protein
MKSLDQLHDELVAIEKTQEKRIAISSLPVTIIRSGSYYLVGSATFSATTGNAITIASSNVVLDLNGATLTSTGAVKGNGIQINGSLRNITVRNGAIAGASSVSTSGFGSGRTWSVTRAGFNNGINCNGSTVGTHFSHLQISGCRFSGLVAVGDGTVIDHITAVHNGDKGISGGSCSISNSSAALNFGQGILAAAGTATGCSATDNQEDGIVGHSVTNCSAFGNGETGLAGNIITNSSSTSNILEGIQASDGSIVNCTAKGNGGDGIRAPNGVVAFCRASNSGSAEINAVGGTRTGNSPAP